MTVCDLCGELTMDSITMCDECRSLLDIFDKEIEDSDEQKTK